MCFLQNPKIIIFFHLFHVLVLAFFRAGILWKCIGSRYFLSLTPTVLGQSFWNFRNFFSHFFHVFNLDVFHASVLWKCIGGRYLVSTPLPTVLDWFFWTPASKKLEGHIASSGLSILHAFLMHSITLEQCMLLFEISFMDSSWKNSWHIFFFLDRIMPLSWVMALRKIMDAILSAKYLNN